MISRGSPNDIPVVVDAVRSRQGLAMVRCNYLSVACDDPKAGWTLNVDGGNLPFMMLGLVGIITQPFNAQKFTDIKYIEDLFELIEKKAGLLVSVDDIWLPMLVFNKIHSEPENGYVYRVNADLFVVALSFREGRLDLEPFIKECQKVEQPLELSQIEIDVFSMWRDMQINNAIIHYPKNSELKLKRREV